MFERLLSIRHWYLSEAFLDRVVPIVIKRLENGKDLSVVEQPHTFNVLSGGVYSEFSKKYGMQILFNEKGEMAAHIPLWGTMFKHSGMCNIGTAELASQIQTANQNKEVFKSIVIDIDTPGGAANSVEVLDRAIRTSGLPVTGWVDTMACSAGQWTASSIAASGGKVIVDSLVNSEMGSIGALMLYQNIAAKLEKEGIKAEIIRAPQSVDKARFNSLEELTKEQRNELLSELKDLTDSFISEVSGNYGGTLKEDTPKLWTGGTFNGAECLEIGLAHEQGDLSHAFNLSIDMANTRKKKTINFNSNMSLFKRLGLSLSLAQKLTAEELENVGKAEERLANAESENTRLSEENGNLTTQVADLTAQLETANSTISTHVATIAERDARIEELEEKPAATTTIVVADGDPEAVAKNQAIIDALPHNIAADANPMFNGSSKPEEK
ncbi:S49 family peptidase [Roseivirga thermotolerans]|uniref:Peptidase S49 domain-containing protein n=1 Tax=Roseivirga thermotolerans TaxID=1758176 RepID=A0ABQ3I960_9BACT|nr:S49 family peptidase [Roseivirga thermotolerans]GHE64894.1 hypothetical protein GCM10011340_19870 [Roseivirga thermotolerans]